MKKGNPRPSPTALAYSIRGFAGKKCAKQAHECYLQVPVNAARAINAANRTVNAMLPFITFYKFVKTIILKTKPEN